MSTEKHGKNTMTSCFPCQIEKAPFRIKLNDCRSTGCYDVTAFAELDNSVPV